MNTTGWGLKLKMRSVKDYAEKLNSITFKIFQTIDKLSKFSNQIAGSGLSSDYSEEKTKRKSKREKHLDKLEQKKKRLQREIDNIKKKRGSKKEKKKLRKKTATEPEILGGFDYKRIGDGMLNQSGHNDEV